MNQTWPFYDPEIDAKKSEDQILFTKTFPDFTPGPDKKFIDKQSKPARLANQTKSEEVSPWKKLSEKPMEVEEKKEVQQPILEDVKPAQNSTIEKATTKKDKEPQIDESKIFQAPKALNETRIPVEQEQKEQEQTAKQIAQEPKPSN